jgi:hypothetical protein
LTTFFHDKELLARLKKQQVAILQFHGPLPAKPTYAGYSGSLFSVPYAGLDVLLKLNHHWKGKAPSYLAYEPIVARALRTQRAALACGHVNRVVGVVWMATAAQLMPDPTLSWGVLLERIPTAQTLAVYVTAHPSRKAQLLADINTVAECLWEQQIVVDVNGINNIITDATGKIWFVDIENEDVTRKVTDQAAKARYLEGIDKYASRTMRRATD